MSERLCSNMIVVEIQRDRARQDILDFVLDKIKSKYGLDSDESALDNWERFKNNEVLFKV